MVWLRFAAALLAFAAGIGAVGAVIVLLQQTL